MCKNFDMRDECVRRDLIRKLLVHDRTRRLGNMKVSFYMQFVYQMWKM